MLYGVHTAARKKPAKKATRRARNDGGLYEKHTTRLDPRAGKEVPYSYWQASRDVAAEHLPPGVERKRFTGTGPTAAAAKARLEAHWLGYHNPGSKKATRKRGAPSLTVAQLFEQWHKPSAGTGSSPGGRHPCQQLVRLLVHQRTSPGHGPLGCSRFTAPRGPFCHRTD